jgi:hypothetical protein
MISLKTFDQWHSVVGYLATALLFFYYPIKKDDSKKFKVLIIIGILFSLLVPFLVEINSQEEQEKLISRYAKIFHSVVFILLLFCYQNKDKLLKSISNFFWFCYCLALFSFLELFVIEVLFSGKYQFVNTIYPFLQINFGIQDATFTFPLNYLIKFIFLSLFFRDLFKNLVLKRVFQYLMYALVLFELMQVFVFKSYQGYDSLSSTVKNILILGGTGLFLYHLYRNDSHGISLQKNPYFWLTMGLLLPALAEIFMEFVFEKLYHTDLLTFYKGYLVRNASQIVGFTLLIVGVWQAKYLPFLPKEY